MENHCPGRRTQPYAVASTVVVDDRLRWISLSGHEASEGVLESGGAAMWALPPGPSVELAKGPRNV
eukprot:5740220-Pyramimonas_sp.AAC.1